MPPNPRRTGRAKSAHGADQTCEGAVYLLTRSSNGHGFAQLAARVQPKEAPTAGGRRDVASSNGRHRRRADEAQGGGGYIRTLWRTVASRFADDPLTRPRIRNFLEVSPHGHAPSRSAHSA